ncbi:ribosome-inactivating family protein [Paracraurococcus lichenis]|uniref:Ribosome-inactivating family protein n=1 Tax=Paracraurococcus lichenis TaxID=3064888 RepID=A0ABT9DVP4_9PROT|nr:ribosome-inactivating family protein [Paracraurococcus sp. LOR1-02]MDO9707969.1 ribosome-inactivating family protein [Paracraurococcus sp. LOR1-02]
MWSFIGLGPYYRQNIRQTRRDVLRERAGRGRVMHVVLGSPVATTTPWIEVALDPRSLYVLGFRTFKTATWWAFEPEGNLPQLEGETRRIRSGPSNYNNLGLNLLDGCVIEPWQFLADLRDFQGRLDEHGRMLGVLLLFVVSEAIRFDTIHELCYRWINQPEQYFRAPDFYYRNPTAMSGHAIAFTPAVKACVRSWRTQTNHRSADVMVPWIAG